MKYIKLYRNESDYMTEIGENTEAILPNISLLREGKDVKFNPNPAREAYFKADYIDVPILSDTKRFINSIFSEMYLNDNKENLIKHNEIIEDSFTILADTDLEYVQEDEWFYYWKNISKKSITASSIESYIIECDEPLLDDYLIGMSFAGGGGSGGGFPPYIISPENTLYDFFSYEGLDINDYRIDENTIDITTVLNMRFSSLGDFCVVIFKLDSDNNPCPINTHNHYKVEEIPEETIDILNTNFVEGVILDFKLECDVEILPTDVLFWCENGECYEFDTVENVINNYGYYYGFGLSEDRKSIVPNENYLPGYGVYYLYGIMRDGDILTHECKISYTNDNFYIYPDKLGENKIRFVLKDRFAGVDCFSNNSYLTRLNNNALVYNRFVPYEAYNYCRSLTSINIPNSATFIGGRAFNYCQSLTNINIPNSVTSIETDAFSNCSSLTKINIPNSVASIAENTFAYCSNLTNVNIPDSVKGISYYAFKGCSSLTNINIPESVTEFGYGVFTNCKKLTTINIPYGVDTIPVELFSGCTSLTNVNIPDSVTSIGSFAFAGCSGLTNINIPNSVSYIDSFAFGACRQLTDIVIPEGVTTIKSNLFNGCWSLTGVTIPNSVTSIETNAFRACRQLTNINIPDSVTSIGNYAFAGSSGLTSINIPNSVTSIGSGVFSGCTSLINVNIPNNLTSIGISMFAYCGNLRNINIPDSVTTIREYAFSDCTMLTSVNVPNNVTFIGLRAFYNCQSVTSVTIGNKVSEILKEGFRNCTRLKELIIGSSMTLINNYAFQDCMSLNKITCLATKAPNLNGSSCFYGVSTNGVLKVPTGSNYSTWLSQLGTGWTVEYI